eukprot:GILK01006831.1.p1 GENE.GILK01006831.1~~GILK01006831.1.p1  ORF type:complete len:922 (+),score=203.02 GILK01006831.1:184-2949(+)
MATRNSVVPHLSIGTTLGSMPPPLVSPTSSDASAARTSIVCEVSNAEELVTLMKTRPAGFAFTLRRAKERLLDLRREISKEARKNFILEHDIQQLDEKIKLLIQNRANLNEIIKEHTAEGAAKMDSPIRALKMQYGELFAFLQSHPEYLAALSRCVEVKHQHSFVQAVVISLYGDQYETREERLLLSLIKMVLEGEFERCTDMGSFMRANDVLTKMLSAYSRRGQGTTFLKDTLEDAIESFISQRGVSLELDPIKIYQQLKKSSQGESDSMSGQSVGGDEEDALNSPDVKEAVQKNKQELEGLCEYFLKRITSSVRRLPFGIRWVCKQLKKLARDRFPQAEPAQIGSIVGGFIYLRYFNPVIAAPEAFNVVKSKPTQEMKRNLLMIAKVLQNLSNQKLFDKEVYMRPMNDFIQRNLRTMLDFFDDVADVEDINSRKALDKYLAHINLRQPSIHISYNEIFVLHQLLYNNVERITKGNADPLRKFITAVGAPPSLVSKSHDLSLDLALSTSLCLQDSHDFGEMSLNRDKSGSFNGSNPEAYRNLKELLFQVLSHAPANASLFPRDLPTILEEIEKESQDSGDALLESHVASCREALVTLVESGYFSEQQQQDRLSSIEEQSEGEESDPEDTATAQDTLTTRVPRMSEADIFDSVVKDLIEDFQKECKAKSAVDREQKRLQQALQSIRNHHDYLDEKLSYYKQYLENCRTVNTQTSTVASKRPTYQVAQTKPEKSSAGSFRYSYKQLESLGVLVDSGIDPQYRKQVKFEFVSTAPGVFMITLSLNGVKTQTHQLLLENLLEKQHKGQFATELDSVRFNTNVLLHLLHTKFVIHLDTTLKYKSVSRSLFRRKTAASIQILETQRSQKSVLLKSAPFASAGESFHSNTALAAPTHTAPGPGLGSQSAVSSTDKQREEKKVKKNNT